VGSELRPALTNAALMDCASAAMVTSVLCASAACVDSVSCIAASAVCPACVHNHLPHPPHISLNHPPDLAWKPSYTHSHACRAVAPSCNTPDARDDASRQRARRAGWERTTGAGGWRPGRSNAVSAISASRNGSVTSRPGTDAAAPSPALPLGFLRSELSIVVPNAPLPECAASAALASCRSLLSFGRPTPHTYVPLQKPQNKASTTRLRTSGIAAAVWVAHVRCDVVQPTGGRGRDGGVREGLGCAPLSHR